MSAIDTALSGLNAASTRLQVSANNIANLDSTKQLVNGKLVNQPFVPQQVTQTSQQAGGVQTSITSVNPASVTVPNGQGGTQQLPNVSLDGEVANQAIATYDFKANLTTIKVADQMNKDLLNIIS